MFCPIIDFNRYTEKNLLLIAEKIDDQIIDDTTLRLTPDEAKLLYNNASYLIAISLTDFSEINRDDFEDDINNEWETESSLIPKLSNEPVIGVIDTQCNEKVYFKDWVEYKNMLDENIPLSDEDYKHGTAVSYIIVDGPQGNPQLEDPRECVSASLSTSETVLREQHKLLAIATLLNFRLFNLMISR